MTYEKSPKLTLNQRQILYGTILGGSSVVKPIRGKNCYLAMRDRDYDWLRYKIEELSNLFKMDSKVIKKDKNTYRSYSIAFPLFNDIYEEFVQGVSGKILEMLTDMAWMIWFIDAGSMVNNKAQLRTTKFGPQGTDLIKNYFCSLDCECKIRSKDNSYSIVFTSEATSELMNTIKHRMPKFIWDRF